VGVHCKPRTVFQGPALALRYSRQTGSYFLRGAAETAHLFCAGVKRRNLACCLNMRTIHPSFLGHTSTGLSLFGRQRSALRQPDLCHYFPTRYGRNLIKGQLMSLRIPQCSAKQREPLQSPSIILDNAVPQIPRLFRRRHCLGQ
jgi:hypothetical protein